jgi:hypothetical protein
MLCNRLYNYFDLSPSFFSPFVFWLAHQHSQNPQHPQAPSQTFYTPLQSPTRLSLCQSFSRWFGPLGAANRVLFRRGKARLTRTSLEHPSFPIYWIRIVPIPSLPWRSQGTAPYWLPCTPSKMSHCSVPDDGTTKHKWQTWQPSVH